jgi:hypothetical protein
LADLPELAIHPKLLPKGSCHFTMLVIRNFHTKLMHAGVAHTLAQIRQEFWIPGSRWQVLKYIRSCLQCKKYDSGPYKIPQVPPLPKARITSSPPFTFTGLDYLGPLQVKSSDGTTKTWICLFMCLATRALHLEIVEDLSAEQFLLCLRRFVAVEANQQ